MRDLQTFQEKIETYRKNAPTAHTQKDLAAAIPLDKDELSKCLNAYKHPQKAISPLSCAQVQAIVRILARWGAIQTQEQAKDLLDLMECPHFSGSDWKVHPLSLLRTTPISPTHHPGIAANPGKPRKELGLLEERSPGGNWAQSSNANTGLKAIPSNIQPKRFGVKLRHHFHPSSSFLEKRIFFGEKEQYRFAFFGLYLPLPEQYKRDGPWLDRTFSPQFEH